MKNRKNEPGFEDAVKEYARKIYRKGWRAGEPLIKKYLKKYKDFDKWAGAVAVMLRVEELLEEDEKKRRKKRRKKKK